MRSNLVRIFSVWLLISAGSPAGAQDAPVVVELQTNAPEAEVYIDGSLAGPASLRRFTAPPGARELKLVVGSGYSWSVPPLTRPIARPSSGDTLRVSLDFPYYYRLESSPGNAYLVLRAGSGSRSLGRTPTTVESPAPLTGRIEFSLDGFKTESVTPGTEIWNLHSVDLVLSAAGEDAGRLALSSPSSRKKWIDYVAVGTALAAGALAVHFKFKADRRYDRYQETGDPDLRPGIKRYDVYSGVALGVMQAGIGLFAIRLALR